MLFPLVHACYKNLHDPIIWAWRNRAKLNFLSDIHWLNDIEPLIALFSFSLCMCNMFCFLSPRWMNCLRYAYIYISYRWDLAATSLAYIWYFDATSVKKTHSHSPPLSFFWGGRQCLLFNGAPGTCAPDMWLKNTYFWIPCNSNI